jgi:hypothetical protein
MTLARKVRWRLSVAAGALAALTLLIAVCSADARLPAPKAVKARMAGGAVTVTWRPVKRAAAYRVRRCVVSGRSCERSRTVARRLRRPVRRGVHLAKFRDARIKRGTVYGYRVMAVDRFGRAGKRSKLVKVRVPLGGSRPDGGAIPPPPLSDGSGPPRPRPWPFDDGTWASGYPTPPAAPHTASPTVFLAPTGSDSNPCTKAAPCRSLNRGYRAAAPGATVELAAGKYDHEQVIDRDSSKTSPDDVVFRPAPGVSKDAVNAGFIRTGENKRDLGANHLSFVDMTTEGFLTNADTNDLHFLNVEMLGNFWIRGGSDVSIVGGSVGGTADGSHPDISSGWNAAGQDGILPTNIYIDGVYFHDVKKGERDDHVECLQLTAVRGITIRNSAWHGCDLFDIHGGHKPPDSLENVLIENNNFEPSTHAFEGSGTYSLSIRGGINVLIRNNSSNQPFALGITSGYDFQNYSVVNNIAPGGACDDDLITYSHNLWTSGDACSSTDRVGAALFVDPAHGDFRLRAGSPGIDHGDKTSFPSTDIWAVPRPQGAGPDIGSNEQ